MKFLLFNIAVLTALAYLFFDNGQMQKISFLRVFASDPDLLILDESTSNLDVESKFKIIQKIKTLNNTTIINSTHEPSSVLASESKFQAVGSIQP